jgi:hypothetical protein
VNASSRALLLCLWIAGSLPLLSGCDSRRPPSGAAPSATAGPGAARPGGGSAPDNSRREDGTAREETSPSSEEKPAREDREQRYRRAVLKEAVDNPKIARLIPHKPVMGGAWRVSGPKSVRFRGQGIVALDYEDGHVEGRLIVHVKDPHDLTTWEVIRDEPP